MSVAIPELHNSSRGHLIGINEIIGIAGYIFQQDHEVSIRSISHDESEAWPQFDFMLSSITQMDTAQGLVYVVAIQNVNGDVFTAYIDIGEWGYWTDVNTEMRHLKSYSGDIVDYVVENHYDIDAMSCGLAYGEDSEEEATMRLAEEEEPIPVDMAENYEACPECNGENGVMHKCLACNGEGVMEVYERMSYISDAETASRGDSTEAIEDDAQTIFCGHTSQTCDYQSVIVGEKTMKVCENCGLSKEDAGFADHHMPSY